jgi:hypothetical protein
MQANASEYDFSQRFRLARRTFHLTADDIRSLKRRIHEPRRGYGAGWGEERERGAGVRVA